MPHKGKPPPQANGGESTFSIEQGIDAVDRLRGQMRQAGMTECADALDGAFVCCLKNFVARKSQSPENGENEETKGK